MLFAEQRNKPRSQSSKSLYDFTKVDYDYYIIEHEKKKWKLVYVKNVSSSRGRQLLTRYISGLKKIKAPVQVKNQCTHALAVEFSQDPHKYHIFNIDNWSAEHKDAGANFKKFANKSFREKTGYIRLWVHHMKKLEEEGNRDEDENEKEESDQAQETDGDNMNQGDSDEDSEDGLEEEGNRDEDENEKEESDQLDQAQETDGDNMNQGDSDEDSEDGLEEEGNRDEDEDEKEDNMNQGDSDEDSEEGVIEKEDSDVERMNLGISKEKTEYDADFQKALTKDMKATLDKARIGLIYLPFDKLIHPEDEVESRNLNEAHAKKIADEIFRDGLVQCLSAKVLLRIDAKWWDRMVTDPKPKSVNEVKTLLENRDILKKNWCYEVWSGAHRRKALETLRQRDEGNPMYESMHCEVFVEIEQGKAEIWEEIGAAQNRTDHHNLKLNVWDVINTWTKRYRQKKKRLHKLPVSTFIAEHHGAFKSHASNIKLGTGKMYFHRIVSFSSWSEKSLKVIRKYHSTGKAEKDLSWCMRTEIRGMNERDYVGCLKRILDPKDRFSKSNMLSYLHRKQWQRLVTHKLTMIERASDSKIKSFNDVKKKYNITSEFPFDLIDKMDLSLAVNKYKKKADIPEFIMNVFNSYKDKAREQSTEASSVDFKTVNRRVKIYESINILAKDPSDVYFIDIVWLRDHLSSSKSRHRRGKEEAIDDDSNVEKQLDTKLMEFKTKFDAAVIGKPSYSKNFLLMIRGSPLLDSTRLQTWLNSFALDDVKQSTTKEFIYNMDSTGQTMKNEIYSAVDMILIFRSGSFYNRSLSVKNHSHLKHNMHFAFRPRRLTFQNGSSSLDEMATAPLFQLLKRYTNSLEIVSFVFCGTCRCSIAAIAASLNARIFVMNKEMLACSSTHLQQLCLKDIEDLKSYAVKIPKIFFVVEGHPLFLISENIKLKAIGTVDKDKPSITNDDEESSIRDEGSLLSTPKRNRREKRSLSEPRTPSASATKRLRGGNKATKSTRGQNQKNSKEVLCSNLTCQKSVPENDRITCAGCNKMFHKSTCCPLKTGKHYGSKPVCCKYCKTKASIRQK
ncbi:hypothetical protein AAMO2058_001651300 [Amorphochlora amoebiformis]